MIVVDASVLIAHFSPGDQHSDAAFDILDTEEEFGIHVVTLAEVLVRPAIDRREGIVAAQIARMGIYTLDARDDEAVSLALLRVQSGLRMPDCCVLVASLARGASLATFDE